MFITLSLFMDFSTLINLNSFPRFIRNKQAKFRKNNQGC